MARKPAESTPPKAAAGQAERPNAPVLRASLEERVRDLEVLVATLLHAPSFEGRPMVQCVSCRNLATRQHRLEHPHAASYYEPACDECSIRHPLAGSPASVLTSEPIPLYPEGAVALAREINRLRRAVLARVVTP